MEQHIIEIVRFAVCILAILAAIVLMVKADDNNIMRRLAVAFAALLVYCNEQIGVMTYLLILLWYPYLNTHAVLPSCQEHT